MRVAALLTCYNRKEKTLKCLEHLFKNKIPGLKVFIVDDGSTDGTSEAVKNQFPAVMLQHGNGSLYWNGGMRMAFEAAMKEEYTHYLWLNDDTLLYENAWSILMESIQKAKGKDNRPSIIVGSTCDPESGKLTYGGLVRNSFFKRLRFDIVAPNNTNIIPCETINGNCVLIEAEVVERIGNLDAYFTHAIGDFDYGLRAKKSNCALWIATGFVGTCAKNASEGTWRDRSMTTKDRINALKSVKGLPNKEWKEFARRYAGFAWPIYWLSPYLRIYIEQIKGRFTSQ